MGTIKISFYDQPTTDRRDLLGRLISSHEDATTTTAVETATVPAGASLARVTSYDVDHYVNLNSTAASTASNREIVLADQSEIFEIPLVNRSTAKKISYRSST